MLAFTARFTDELLSGAWAVLTPLFRRVFRLSLVQVGLLTQVLAWVALFVEPVTAAMIDLHSRRRLLLLGATALMVSMLAMAAANSYGWLMVSFAAFGIGSGPLVHTGDVLVVESFPGAAQRAYARATFVDTAGALLGPGLVAAATAAHVSWRVVLVALAAYAGLYAFGVSVTAFPGPRRRPESDRPLIAELADGVRAAVKSPGIRRSLVVLFCFDIFEAAFVLKYIWLHDDVGLGYSAVALWATVEQAVDLVALVLLDRWLITRSAGRLFRVAAAALIALPAVWALAPGIAGRVIVAVPLSFAHALLWPLAKSQSLTVDTDLAGATQALAALFPIVPLAVVQATLAERLGLGSAMAVTAAVGAAAMLIASRPTVLGNGEK